MSMTVATIISFVCTIIATVVICVMFLSESKSEKYGKAGQVIHSIINFKFLIIEKILKVFYVFSTVFVILLGFFMLFSFQQKIVPAAQIFLQQEAPTKTWAGGRGILLMLLGPIVNRLIYETLMMFVLLVDNTISINKKLSNKNKNNNNNINDNPLPPQN